MDRFVPWYEPPNLLPPSNQTLPQRWEDAFRTQLANWRSRRDGLKKAAEAKGLTHGMLPWQTWMFPVGVPLGEAVKPEDPQPPKERLVLVCLPPLLKIQEGDRVEVSDPRNLERPPQAAKMPLEILTVPDSPRLLLPHELDSLAWAASEDREALVGDLFVREKRASRG
jgi:hypothetical protein